MKTRYFDGLVKRAAKWVLPFCLFAFLPLSLDAQTSADATGLKYGYVSYDAVLRSMSGYAALEASMQQLADKYEAEQERAESEFNLKYEEFLDGQRDFPQTILQKRQSELQELLSRNVAFKQESQRLLQQARAEAEAPLRRRLTEALGRVGMAKGLAFIVNTDQQPMAWTHPLMGEDVTAAVKEALKK